MAKNARSWPVDFDPEKVLPGTSRLLSELELAAVWIYLEKGAEMTAKRNSESAGKKGGEPNFPRPKHFDGIFKRRIFRILKENGTLDSYAPGEERKSFLDEQTHNLFRGLMFDSNGNDLRDTISPVEIIRRITGLGNIFYTEDDLSVAMLAMDKKLREENPLYESGTMTYADVRRIYDSGWVVPSLGIPIPEPATFVDRISKAIKEEAKWVDVLEHYFNTNVELQRKRQIGFDLNDIEEDYISLTLSMREELGDPDYLPITSDLDDRSKNHRSVIRSDEYMKVLRENSMTFDDLRELIGERRLKRINPTLPRTENFMWSEAGKLSPEQTKAKVLDAYINLWAKTNGVSISSDDDIRRLVTSFAPPRNGDTLEQNVDLAKRSRIEGLSSDDVIPSHGVICEYFGGINQLLADIEEKYDVEVCLSNPHQRTSLAAVARDQNIPIKSVPKMVRELLI